MLIQIIPHIAERAWSQACIGSFRLCCILLMCTQPSMYMLVQIVLHIAECTRSQACICSFILCCILVKVLGAKRAYASSDCPAYCWTCTEPSMHMLVHSMLHIAERTRSQACIPLYTGSDYAAYCWAYTEPSMHVLVQIMLHIAESAMIQACICSFRLCRILLSVHGAKHAYARSDYAAYYLVCREPAMHMLVQIMPHIAQCARSQTCMCLFRWCCILLNMLWPKYRGASGVTRRNEGKSRGNKGKPGGTREDQG